LHLKFLYMHIGFDAKRAYQNGTGLGHYSRTLIRSLAEYFPENRYTLFAPKETDRFNVSQYPGMQLVTPTRFPDALLRSLWRSRRVTRDLRERGINLYHGLSHEIPVGIRETGIRSVVTVHDLIFERYPHQYKTADIWIHRHKIKYACRNADKVIAISAQTRDDLIGFYQVPADKIEICYQSCNPAFGIPVGEETIRSIKKKYGLPETYFLYVGSIIERKNLLGICQAIHILKDKLHIPLVAIGQGSAYKEKVNAYIREHKLEDRIILMSDNEAARHSPTFRNAEDFPAIYQGALAMIYPSTFEGFGIPVLEALLAKLPAITSNISCLPETGGNAAYYVDPYSPQSMADALEAVGTNPQLRADMIEKGIAHAAGFSPKACAEAVNKVYQSIL